MRVGSTYTASGGPIAGSAASRTGSPVTASTSASATASPSPSLDPRAPGGAGVMALGETDGGGLTGASPRISRRPGSPRPTAPTRAASASSDQGEDQGPARGPPGRPCAPGRARRRRHEPGTDACREVRRTAPRRPCDSPRSHAASTPGRHRRARRAGATARHRAPPRGHEGDAQPAQRPRGPRLHGPGRQSRVSAVSASDRPSR